MRTVLSRSAGRASFILVIAGMVGSVALPAVPALAGTASRHPALRHGDGRQAHHDVRLGPAVKFVRDAHGHVHRVR